MVTWSCDDPTGEGSRVALVDVLIPERLDELRGRVRHGQLDDLGNDDLDLLDHQPGRARCLAHLVHHHTVVFPCVSLRDLVDEERMVVLLLNELPAFGHLHAGVVLGPVHVWPWEARNLAVEGRWFSDLHGHVMHLDTELRWSLLLFGRIVSCQGQTNVSDISTRLTSISGISLI